jgi:hypothetical protein
MRELQEFMRKIYYYFRKILFLDFGKIMEILFNFLFWKLELMRNITIICEFLFLNFENMENVT